MSSQEHITLDQIVHARATGALTSDSYTRLLNRILEPLSDESWRKNLRHWFLVGGLLLLVSGIIYFGAYNWEHLGRLQKLGLLQIILLAFFSGVMLRGLERTEGKVLLMAGCGIVGAILAVMGQVYQTGADSYTLFLGWGVLILPWCLAGRSNLLWTGQLALVNVAFTFWWYQTVNERFFDFALPFLALNLLLIGLWEALRQRLSWMKRTVSDLLLAIGLTPVTLTGCAVIVDAYDEGVTLLCLFIVLGALIFFCGKRLISMAIVSASLLCLGSTLVGRICLESGDEFGVLMTGVGIMFLIALVVRWLTHLHQTSDYQPSATPVGDEFAKSDTFDLTREEREALAGNLALPWYVQALIGTGAWFASLFVLIFFLLAFSRSDGGLALLGGLLYGGSLFVRNKKEPALFFRHALLSVHISGIMVSIAGVAVLASDEQVVGGLVGTALLALSARYYADTLGIFLFALGFVTCGAVTADGALARTCSILWVIAVMVLIAYLSTRFKTLLQTPREKLLPVLRGLTAGLLSTILVLDFELLRFTTKPILAIVAIAITVWISRRLGHPSLAQTGLLALGVLTYTVPSLIVSTFVYLVGCQTQQKLVRGLGILSVAASAWFFYYNLDLTLMTKSFALISSGGALLFFRVLLGMGHQESRDLEESYAL